MFKIKLILNIKLIGEKTVKIKFLHIHSNISKYEQENFFHNQNNNFFYYRKNDNFSFGYNKLVIPKNPNKYDIECVFVFKSDEERREVLERFSKSLIVFSKGGHFISENKTTLNHKITYLDNNNWIVY